MNTIKTQEINQQIESNLKKVEYLNGLKNKFGIVNDTIVNKKLWFECEKEQQKLWAENDKLVAQKELLNH